MSNRPRPSGPIVVRLAAPQAARRRPVPPRSSPPRHASSRLAPPSLAARRRPAIPSLVAIVSRRPGREELLLAGIHRGAERASLHDIGI
jgi:hypothetical protein